MKLRQRESRAVALDCKWTGAETAIAATTEGMGRALAEVLEREIAAEAEAEERDALGVAQGEVDDAAQIVRVAAVVGAGEAVRLTAATAEAPCDDVPARGDEGLCDSAHVRVPRGTLETVGEDGRARRANMVDFEIDEIAVGQLEAMRASARARVASDHRAEDRLDVGVREPERRAEG